MITIKFKLLITCLWLSMLFISTTAQPKSEPLEIEDILNLNSFENDSIITLSPTGKFIAYTVINQSGFSGTKEERYLFYNRNGITPIIEGCSVWITNTESKDTIKITGKGSTSFGPAWSHDGKYLAYYSDKGGKINLWVYDVKSNESRMIEGGIPHPFFPFETPVWSPNNRSVYIKVLPEGESIEDSIDKMQIKYDKLHNDKNKSESSVVVYSFPPTENNNQSTELLTPPLFNFTMNRYLSDIAEIDIFSGNIKRIVRGSRTTSYSLSPDGKYLIYASVGGYESKDSHQLLYNLNVISIDTGKVHHVIPGVRMTYSRPISWAPNSKLFSYTTSGLLADRSCHIVDIESNSEKIIKSDKYKFGANPFAAPAWDRTSSKIYLISNNELVEILVSSGEIKQVTSNINRYISGVVTERTNNTNLIAEINGQFIIATKNEKNHDVGFYAIEGRTGKSTNIVEFKKSFGGIISHTMDMVSISNSIYYIAQSSSEPQNIWRIDTASKNTLQITNINPFVDKYKMGQSQLIEWKDDYGRILKGALLLPADYVQGKRYPMILQIYCGRPGSRFLNTFGMSIWGNMGNMQIFSTRGYAVFYPDIPDIPPNTDSIMKYLSSTLMPGVKKIIDIGIADPNRLGITGASFGGHNVLSVIIQTDQFKAAVSIAGIGNVISYYGMLDKDGSDYQIMSIEKGQFAMEESLWENKNRYIENSPVFHLDRITTPVMLVHGALDATVLSYQSDEIFVGLRRLNKEVIYAKYYAGEHTEATFNYPDSFDYLNRVTKWFDSKLKTNSSLTSEVK